MLGENIKAIIDKSEFSVSDVAKKMGTTNQNLYYILKKDSIDSKYLEQFAKILNIPINIFFENNNSNELYTSTEINFKIKINDSIIHKIFTNEYDINNINDMLDNIISSCKVNLQKGLLQELIALCNLHGFTFPQEKDLVKLNNKNQTK